MKNKSTDKPDKVINAVIIDDDQRCINELKTHLADEKKLNIIAEINDPRQAVDEIIQTKPELLFLDIQMPVLDGFDIINILKQEGHEPYVIFITAYDKYAIKAIKNSVFDYLLKPVDKRELLKSLSRFYTVYSKDGRNINYTDLLETISFKQIKFSTFGGFFVINPDDIIYIKADWNYSKIYSGTDDYETVTTNIGSVEKMLPDNSFMRINRSTIINLKYLSRVKRLLRKCVLQKDGVVYELSIPIKKIRELEKKL